MSYQDAVYLAGLLGALLFFASGYLFHASRVGASHAQAPQPATVDELVHELEREQRMRVQAEQTVRELQAVLGRIQGPAERA